MTDRNAQGEYLPGHSEPGPGRPPLYANPIDFEQAVNAYFDQLGDKPPTIAGLCLAIGFNDKHSFAEQAKRGDAFSATVGRAKLRIEAFLEGALYDKSKAHAGLQFALSANYGWNPKSKVEHQGTPPITKIKLVAPESFARH